MRQAVLLVQEARVAQAQVSELEACSTNRAQRLQVKALLRDEIANQNLWAGQAIEVLNPVSMQMVLIQDS